MCQDAGAAISNPATVPVLAAVTWNHRYPGGAGGRPAVLPAVPVLPCAAWVVPGGAAGAPALCEYTDQPTTAAAAATATAATVNVGGWLRRCRCGRNARPVPAAGRSSGACSASYSASCAGPGRSGGNARSGNSGPAAKAGEAGKALDTGTPARRGPASAVATASASILSAVAASGRSRGSARSSAPITGPSGPAD